MRKHLKTIIFLLTATAFHAFSVDNDMERFFAGPRSGDIRLPADQVIRRDVFSRFRFIRPAGGASPGEVFCCLKRSVSQIRIKS